MTDQSLRELELVKKGMPLSEAVYRSLCQALHEGRYRSGDRLRDWLGVDREAFYDRRRFAVLPMAFCFPGYDAKGADLPPPPICAATWRARALAALPEARLKLLVGGYALRWHLRDARPVAEIVRDWRAAPDGVLPVPHPSWRNTGWLKRNPWFETDLVPALRARVASLLETVAR